MRIKSRYVLSTLFIVLCTSECTDLIYSFEINSESTNRIPICDAKIFDEGHLNRHYHKCKFIEKNSVVCNNGIDDSFQRYDKIHAITLCDWPHIDFNATKVLKKFFNVRKLELFHGNVSYFSDDFPELRRLAIVNITRTALKFTKPTLFQHLENLEILDLRNNRLVKIARELHLPNDFKELYLNGNPWNCSNSHMKWLLHEENYKFLDKYELRCTDLKYNGRPLMTVMQYKQNLKNNCQNGELRNCTCHISYIRLSDDGKNFHPMIAVDCSHLGLESLPKYLPENTTVLYATNNRISDLEMLNSNEHYKAVTDIHLDFNLIKSIRILEDSDWLDRVRVLSLKGNKFSKIQFYILRNAIEKNHVAKIYLSQNPWTCDCYFAVRYQDFLMEHHAIVVDSKNISCKYMEDGIIIALPVLTLRRTDVCKLPESNKANIYNILSCVFGSLIILIIFKLAFDYYNYRNYGKLPWIVTKMP